MAYSCRSPLEGQYEDEVPAGYGVQYSPHGNWPKIGSKRNHYGEQVHNHGHYGRHNNQDHERGHSQNSDSDYGEPSTSFHSQIRYSDRFKPPSYPRALTDLFGPLECKLCGVDVPSPIVAKMHYSGKQHKKKIKSFLTEWCLRTGSPMPDLGGSIQANATASSLGDYCEVCDLRLTSVNDKVLHYAGKQHLKNERDPVNAKKRRKLYEVINTNNRFGIGTSFNPPEVEEYVDPPFVSKKELECYLCNVKAVSIDQLQAHLNGKKHKEKLEKKESAVPKQVNPALSILASIVKDQPRDTIDYSMHRTPSERPYACKLCGVSLDTERLWRLHLEGKRHTKTVLKLEIKEADYCEICDVTFTSFDQYQSHIQGKKHEKRCQKKYQSTIQIPDEKCSLACKFCPFVGNIDEHKCDMSLTNIEHQDLEKKFVCFTCHNMVFDSEEEFNEHKNSRRHLLCALNQDDADKIIEELQHWYCFTCRKQYRNHKDYTEHMFEQRHTTLSSGQNLDSKTDLFQCTVCDIILDKEAKEEHTRSRRHLKQSLKKDTLLTLTRLANEDIGMSSFHCTNCNVIANCFIDYSRHVLSDDHIERMITFNLQQI